MSHTSKGQDRLRHADIKHSVVSIFIRLLYDFRCLPRLKARFLRGRNSCSASSARAGVEHQNGGGELHKGMSRVFVRRRRDLDGLMPRFRACASFGWNHHLGAGYYYQFVPGLRTVVQGSQAAQMPRWWEASRRVRLLRTSWVLQGFPDERVASTDNY